jgi:cell division septation protein DedD
MSEREEEPRPARNPKRGSQSPARFLYGALLVAIGGCLGIVIGSVSDTPRILFERLRGPVETVDLEPAPAAPAPVAAPPLEAFGELQGAPAAAKPKPAPVAAKPAEAKPEPAKAAAKAEPKPAPEPKSAPAVSAAPPAKSPDEIVRELEKKTAAAPAAPAKPAATTGTVVQVLSLADQKQADTMIARLRAQGFEPYASPMPNKAGKLRVRVRPKSGETTAALETRLRELGFKTWTTSE